MHVRAALSAGLALLATSVILVLSGSPPHVVGTNSVSPRVTFAAGHGGMTACQPDELLPRGTSSVRLTLEAVIGPSVAVTVLAGGRVLTRGVHRSGWTGADVIVPIEHIQRTTPNAKVCFALGASREVISMVGERSSSATAVSNAEGVFPGRLRIEYLADGDRSWWSQARSVARRIGIGRAPSGAWIVLLIASLMAAVAALAAWLSMRELSAGTRTGGQPRDRPTGRLGRLTSALGGVPTAAWICALVACLNAVCWSILTPPFQVPDETAHFAYVQQLAEAGQLPVLGTGGYSPEEEVALADLHHNEVQFMPSARTISTRAQEQKLEEDLAQPLPRRGSGDAGVATREPPLYYLLEAIPYGLGSGGTLLDRLQLMRLFSSVFGALTALFAFLFVREALPGAPWAWTVGGLGVALAPLLGFISGAVNPDAMLLAVSAALFYLLARGFRRGLTRKLAAAVGAAIAIGLLTKLNFLGLLPGAILGLILMARRAPRESRRAAYAALALALAVGASPVLLYVAPLVNHAPLSLLSSSVSTAQRGGSVFSEISYIWQFYLPRLPGMTNYFPGVFTSRQLWFDGLVGLYGWADTVFPGWVDDVALVPAGLAGLLCVRALFTDRAALRRRTAEPFVYAVMGAGVLALVGGGSYINDVLNNLGPFWQPRYLLPMLPLLGAALALAARGAGRRWGPAVGALIVVLILAHDVFSQLLVISRYYS